MTLSDKAAGNFNSQVGTAMLFSYWEERSLLVVNLIFSTGIAKVLSDRTNAFAVRLCLQYTVFLQMTQASQKIRILTAE